MVVRGAIVSSTVDGRNGSPRLRLDRSFGLFLMLPVPCRVPFKSSAATTPPLHRVPLEASGIVSPPFLLVSGPVFGCQVLLNASLILRSPQNASTSPARAIRAQSASVRRCRDSERAPNWRGRRRRAIERRQIFQIADAERARHQNPRVDPEHFAEYQHLLRLLRRQAVHGPSGAADRPHQSAVRAHWRVRGTRAVSRAPARFRAG